MAGPRSVGGLQLPLPIPLDFDLGFDRPLVLVGLPLAALALWYLLFRRGDSATGPTTAGRGERRLLFLTRLVVVGCLLVAAAGPTAVAVRETPGDPQVTLLVDDSESMALTSVDTARLVRDIEAGGVPVTTVTVARGTDSRLGEAVVEHSRPDGSLVLVSDGRVTGGRSLDAAAEVARGANTTLNTVALEPSDVERAVDVAGPEKTSVGVENAFLVRVTGVGEGDSRTLTVTVDGQQVVTRQVAEAGEAVEFTHSFATTGDHRVVATLDGEDVYDDNDVARLSVRVVDRPAVLYVSRGEYPFATLLDDLYDVTRAESVPSDLDPYTAVVIQDVAADDLGDVAALQRFVIEGNGLVVTGGRNAFENGDYATSPLSGMLPVQSGEAGGGDAANVVLLVDVSGSASAGMRIQKALALDVLDQLGDDQRVGVVAFNDAAYRIVDPAPLATSRPVVEDTIRRLQAGGGTNIGAGLVGAADMLGDEGGSVILISDGVGQAPTTIAAADRLAARDTRVVTVGVGSVVDESLLRIVAETTGGTYVRADETNRLRLLFQDDSRPFSADVLTVVDDTHFVTSGVTLQSNPTESHDVSVRPGADYLVASGSGDPAVATWRYGLGRVLTVTAYGSDGTLDGLLARPDSLLLTKGVNWAVGDPERKATNVLDVPDTRVGEAVTATYVGDDRPTSPEVRFVRVGETRYEATVVPTEPGFETLLDAEYAVDYPAEYAAFGPSPTLASATETTGGRTFAPDEGRAIANFAKQRATKVRVVRESLAWAFLTVALVVYLLDVAVRRLKLYYRGAPTGGGR
ncbi:von Willebrand factor type A domain-containing protein [Halogranum amylolyticum]|uniref:von Willebrand factor type A domain-containing protein n=1 Tax=Halogranum amylolyticum TaxID=660520 RepID=A0A1H8W504_9EURY|nr:VWA domain-containing protein [Halogranum amylolyticum]SEP22722.1 von Willebrand factor type A domain-containing protein [Halogranum amylolyticum]